MRDGNLNGVDLVCKGTALDTQLPNGHRLVNLFATELVSVGLGGERVSAADATAPVLWVERNDLTNNPYPPTGNALSW